MADRLAGIAAPGASAQSSTTAMPRLAAKAQIGPISAGRP